MAGEIDTVILAGGFNRISLYPGHRPGWKALEPLAGRTLLQHALRAAGKAEAPRRLIVVGPPEVCTAAQHERECRTVAASESLLENVRAGAAAAETERVLFMTADLPLARGEMLDEFAAKARDVDADLTGAFVNQARMGRYAGTHKPFLRFADGAWQHGNLFMIPRASLHNRKAWQPLDRIYRARKNGLRTAAVLGPGLLWWFLVDVLLLHRPTLHQAVEHVSKVVGARLAAVESSFPEVMLDIDEPEDYALAEQALRSDGGGAAGLGPAAAPASDPPLKRRATQ